MPRYLTDRCKTPIALPTLIALLLSVEGWSATNGEMGPTSTGSLQITLRVEPSVRISALQDMAISTAADQRGESPACIHASPGGSYQLSFSGSGQDQNFDLHSSEERVRYQVHYDDGHRTLAASPGMPLLGLQGADPVSPNCDTTGHNGRVIVEMAEPGQRDTPAGLYTGTLTLLIAPD
ncbi:MAG: hypothetical protein ACR2PZ_25695 [Pseudomonadales bacterium]